LIIKSFVPVALNANRIPDDEAGRFFKKIMQNNKWPQGLWIATAEGKVLAFHYFRVNSGEATAQSKKRWIQETHETLEEGLKAFGPVPARDLQQLAGYNPLPDRGLGLHPDGSVRLALSACAFRKGQREGDPAVDSIWLSAKDWAMLAPPKTEVGTSWDVPQEAAAKFVPAFSPMTDLIYVPQPKDAKTAEMKATVISAKDGVAKIQFVGRWETVHSRDGDGKLPVRTSAKGEGVAFFDQRHKEMRSLLLVADGEYRNVPPWDKPQATGSIVEWQMQK
jgi:hypothetical protein